MGAMTLNLSAALGALVTLLAASFTDAATEVFQVPFTTDLDVLNATAGLYGPDGPWQAAVLMMGTWKRASLYEPMDGGPVVPLYPSGLNFLQVLTTEAGGEYNRSNASAPYKEYGNSGDNTMRLIDLNANHSTEGAIVIDGVTLVNNRMELPGYSNANATIYAMNASTIHFPNGRSYVPEVGTLGLGRPFDVLELPGTGIVDQLKAQGLITSSSFGLHIGSAAFGQRGSLILGGYEENRIIGPVATFKNVLGVPVVFLVDVNIDVEIGRWPFNASEIGSIWEGTTDEYGQAAVKAYSGKNGSVIIDPNGAVPGIYLPGPTCANAAKHLPVRYDSALGYYLWNTDDPTYASIVRSGAYMGFILSDSDAKNVTIKVPFTLLNLTLDSPIVDTPTSYFPCHDVTSQQNGYWELGRAFLQAAFLGVNYDTNTTFIAQAPGPNMNQSVVHTLKPSDTSVVSGPVDSFAESWRPYWTALDAASSATSTDTKKPLGAAAIGGIVIGVIAGLALALLGWFFWWRRRAARALAVEMDSQEGEEMAAKRDSKEYRDMPEMGAGQAYPVYELGPSNVAELDSPGKLAVSELDSPVKINEAPGSPGVYEMPVHSFASREELMKR
ncbi:aspartic peptidase domain-containing protein [Podospora appendiculata]|uniref:Aspartic peptidase domain-containing protein n=1 Tax=Podospora appendiculata TaxID=314037 RepID=A0AAE0XM35_9PEZI|nr:aspartic peptidase domain-containing protein [Podospora appendiculata]